MATRNLMNGALWCLHWPPPLNTTILFGLVCSAVAMVVVVLMMMIAHYRQASGIASNSLLEMFGGDGGGMWPTDTFSRANHRLH